MRFPTDTIARLLAIGAALAPLACFAQTCDNCGVVTAVQISTQEEEWTPLGVVSTGPATLGPAGTTEARSNFAFDKQGSRGLVVVGAAGGAAYARKPNSYKKPRWDVTVKMDAGGTRVIQQRYEPFVREGDRVRVLGTQIELES